MSPLSSARRFRRRRGIALLVVLLLVSVTLGLSYAAIRSQFTSLQIQGNSQRRFSARQAAVTGIAMAIKNMRSGTWTVDDSPLQGRLDSDVSFQVEFKDNLAYWDLPDPPGFPYLVTLTSTGEAADPDNRSSVAVHRIEAVLRLIRHLSDWSNMPEYSGNTTGINSYEIKSLLEDWVQPTSLTTYQIYPDGPVYTIEEVGPTVSTNLWPDLQMNPLGIYYRDHTITIEENVTIRGSLFCKDDIKVQGKGVSFKPVELPGLYGDDDPVRLPAVSCRKFIVVENTGGATVTGLVAVFDKFIVKRNSNRNSFTAEGPLAIRDPDLDPPIKPITTSARYYWYNSQNPVYVAGPEDGSLRWDLIEWTENPNWGESP